MNFERLKELRSYDGYTQQDVANYLNVKRATYAGWETGKDTIPIDRLIEYANEYSLSLDYLFGLISKNETYYPLNIDLDLLARNLTELRLKNHFTQTHVAKKLNTSQAAYSHYETASNIIPTTFLYGLTRIYEPFSIDQLFGRKKKIINK